MGSYYGYAHYHRAYYLRNRERILAYSKAYALAHPKQRMALYRKARYDLSDEEYRALLKKQHGRCAICKRVMRPPQVDHDHKTRKVRGLLCGNCNRGIGHLQDDIKVLAAAIGYLQGD